jgi:hypothetical protein
MDHTNEILDELEKVDFNSIEYVKAATELFVLEGLTVGFHPDTPFEDYVDEKGNPVYEPGEAHIRNIIMDHLFDVCEKEGVCIYEVTGRITLRGTPFETMLDEDHETKYAEFMRDVESGRRIYNPSRIGDVTTKEMFQAKYN